MNKKNKRYKSCSPNELTSEVHGDLSDDELVSLFVVNTIGDSHNTMSGAVAELKRHRPDAHFAYQGKMKRGFLNLSKEVNEE